MPETAELTPSLIAWRRTRANAITDSQRRRPEMREINVPLELRDEVRVEDPDTGGEKRIRTLRSYASLFGEEYTVGSGNSRFTESVKSGAFKRSLSQNPDIVFRRDHTGPPLARTTNYQGKTPTLRLGEDERGLWYEADLDLNDPDVQALLPKIERGDLSESSFAFRCVRDKWDEDYTTRTLEECNLDRGDCSLVVFGASRATGDHLVLRSEEALQALREISPDKFVAAWAEWRDYTLLPVEQREGKVLSSSSMQILRHVLNLVEGADDALDSVQPLLADLMGLPNPNSNDANEGTQPKTGAVTSAEQLTHLGRAEDEIENTEARDTVNAKVISPLPADQARTTPHLLDTVISNLAHAQQHAGRLFDSDVIKSSEGQQFNAQHLKNHLDEAQVHAHKLDDHLSEHPSDPKVHRSEREQLTAQRDEEMVEEHRDEPSDADWSVMHGLREAKLALAAVKAKQLADPDNATDPDDKKVMAQIEAAEAAIDAAITAQGKDGRPDPPANASKAARSEEAATGEHEETRAPMSSADQNDLPDSAFAYIEPGGKKDSEGKTTPRSLRHFPINDAAHVRNALARASQSPFGKKAMPKILAAAKKFGIEVSRQETLAENDTDDLIIDLRMHQLRRVS